MYAGEALLCRNTLKCFATFSICIPISISLTFQNVSSCYIHYCYAWETCYLSLLIVVFLDSETPCCTVNIKVEWVVV